MKKAQKEDPIQFEEETVLPKETAGEAAETDTIAADAGALPVEPPPPWSTAAANDAGYDPAAALADLQRFYFYGKRDAESPTSNESLPAALHPYRDLSGHRYEYPLCVNGKGSGVSVRPLLQVIDELIAESAGEGDEGERLRRHVYRVESAIKARAERDAHARLSSLWNEAAEDVINASKLSPERREILSRNLTRAGQALTSDGEVIPCTKETPLRLFAMSARAHWRSRTAEWRDDLAALIHKLEDILTVDDEHSPEAMSPDHLRHTVGPRTGDEIDSQAMAAILGASELNTPLAETRRRRVENVLTTLRVLAPVYGLEGGKPPLDVGAAARDCDSAIQEYKRRMDLFAGFFKAVRIGRLEVANGYREVVHDEFFQGFDRSYLTGDELSLCPPVVLILDPSTLRDGKVSDLFNLLSSDVPVKTLLVIDSIFEDREEGIHSNWLARLGGAAIAMNRAFVFQAPVSRPSLMLKYIERGMAFDGPSLFAVYAPGQAPAARSAYLDAAAAGESRCFPIVVFDPSGGERLVDRISLSENPKSEDDWPHEAFSYRTADEETATTDLGFTPAELLYCDTRFASHFWNVPARRWHKDMVPFAEFIDMDAGSTAGRIPFVTTVGKNGRVGRAVPRITIVETAVAQRAYWRQLQEIGGIHNSFALAAIEKEKVRLAEEKRLEIEKIEKNYVAQIDQDIGELTREIVQRIASRLVDEDATGVVTRPAPLQPTATARPVVSEPAPQTAETPEETAGGDSEDEVAVLDEAYIDTPLCTSCNECTQLNSQIFAYNGNKQAYIKDPAGGPYKDLVRAAELCPVRIIHPGKPGDPNEPGLEQWVERAAPFA